MFFFQQKPFEPKFNSSISFQFIVLCWVYITQKESINVFHRTKNYKVSLQKDFTPGSSATIRITYFMVTLYHKRFPTKCNFFVYLCNNFFSLYLFSTNTKKIEWTQIFFFKSFKQKKMLFFPIFFASKFLFFSTKNFWTKNFWTKI